MTEKLPSIEVMEIGKENLMSQKEMRLLEHVKRLDISINVQFTHIKLRKDWNLRQDFGEIEELASSIESQGLITPIVVDILKDGTILLKSGERRYRAIAMLRARSKELKTKFEFVPALINNRDMDEKGRLISELNSNSGKPFTALEEAEGYKILRDQYEMDLKTIGRAVGHSASYVEQRLLLADEGIEIKKAVESGAISATAVVQMNREEKDPIKRKEKVEKAVSEGKKVKVTPTVKVALPDNSVIIRRDFLEELIKVAKDQSYAQEYRGRVVEEAEKLLTVKL